MDSCTEYQSLGVRTSISISVYGGVHVLVCTEYHIDRSCARCQCFCTYCLRVRAIVSGLVLCVHCGGSWHFIESRMYVGYLFLYSYLKSSLKAIHWCYWLWCTTTKSILVNTISYQTNHTVSHAYHTIHTDTNPSKSTRTYGIKRSRKVENECAFAFSKPIHSGAAKLRCTI